ncbi:helix-turn-helix domain-containing protein [Lentzea sp. NPDC060358]|uniref:helix-turn-helix domain-containing protein n=1 Tax=Lentzea sp. NPDC060358 TaxID=3347103 RepID=UPI00364ECB9E
MTRVDSMTFALPHADLLRARATAVDFDAHLHGTCSVVVVTSGSAQIWSHRWSRSVHAGDVFFFNPFEVHSGRTTGGPARYDVLYPSEAFLDTCAGPAGPGEVRSIRTGVVTRGRATRALADAVSDPAAGHAPVEDALRQVLRECRFTVEASTATPSSIVRTAARLIEENGPRSTRTADLAREIGVNPSHLARAFRRTVGVPPQTYARQVRVARARELICAGVELDDVAQLAHFADQPHLTREFKKVFGVPPGALSRGVGR